jgi:tetratricopeptide (TPR) repeat protein
MRKTAVAGLALAAGLAAGPMPSRAQATHDHTHAQSGPILGEVHFPVSCSPEAQAAFDTGMKLQHSFWYQAARDAFREAAQRDPNCAMALWGQALTLLNNPFTPPVAANLREGKALLERAQAMGPRTEREAGFIAALATLFAGDDLPGHRARLQRYEEAMAALHQRLPDDPEVAILYALSLNMAAPATDKTYAKQRQAAAILEAEATRQPQHPGVAHYLIHTYDVPALASQGVPAAERYAALAADAPHALHMPSHIFTRVGRWQESIETNSRSAATARAREETFDEIHALDYMVYAYLQTGQPAAARRVLVETDRLARWTPDRPLGGYALTAMPARVALERGDWPAAAALDTRSFGVPYVDATTQFARALGAARTGQPDAATPDIAALKAGAAALAGRDAYWQEQVEIMRVAAEGWVAYARGGRDQALALLQEATEREARTEKHPVTPGPLAPAREQLAELLLLLDRPADAQREFEAVQQTEPRRFRAVDGAARSAVLAGDKDAARRHYTALLEIAAPAEQPNASLATAREYLAGR